MSNYSIITEEWNTILAKIGKTVSESVPSATTSFHLHLKNGSSVNFFMHPADINDIINVVTNLKNALYVFTVYLQNSSVSGWILYDPTTPGNTVVCHQRLLCISWFWWSRWHFSQLRAINRGCSERMIH